MGGGKGDAPDPPDYGPLARASEKAAEYGYKTSQEQLAWAKERYNLDRDLADTLIGDMRERSALQDQWAQEDRQRYQETFRPLEDQMVKEAGEYDTPERRRAEAEASMASVASQTEQARRAAQRNLEGFGINPGDTRYAALDVGSRTQQAAAQAGAGNQAMRQVEATAQAMKANAANLGRGFQVNPLAASQAALAGNQAAGGMNLATTASGQAGMGTPTQWMGVNQGAISNWGNVLNMGYNNQLAQWQANQNAAGSGIGSALGLLGAAGTFFAAEGGEIPASPPRAALPIGSVPRMAARPPAGQPPRAPAGALPTGGAPGMAAPFTGNTVPAAAATAVGNDPNAPQDTVHAMVKPGEYVVPKHVVDWYGQKGMQDMIAKAEKARQGARQPTYAEMQPGQMPPVSYVSQGIPA